MGPSPRKAHSPWCAAAGGSCLCLGLLEIPWHRGGCVSVAEAEVGHEGARGGLWLPPHLALLGKFLGGLTISLHHPYLWLSIYFLLTSGVSFLFKAHHLKSNSFPGSPGRSPSPFKHKGWCVSLLPVPQLRACLTRGSGISHGMRVLLFPLLGWGQ